MIFTAFVACKNPIWNQVRQTWFFKSSADQQGEYSHPNLSQAHLFKFLPAFRRTVVRKDFSPLFLPKNEYSWKERDDLQNVDLNRELFFFYNSIKAAFDKKKTTNGSQNIHEF